MYFDPIDMPVCSRSPFGKYDDAIERLPVHSHIKQALSSKASALGMNLSEYVRTVLECNVLGVKAMADLHAQRLRVIAGTQPSDVPCVDTGDVTGVPAVAQQEQAAGAQPRQLAAA